MQRVVGFVSPGMKHEYESAAENNELKYRTQDKDLMNAQNNNDQEITAIGFAGCSNLTATETLRSLRRPNTCGDEKISTGPPPHLGAAKPRFDQTLAQSL